jgi:Domain of unknown function (DUF4177)
MSIQKWEYSVIAFLQTSGTATSEIFNNMGNQGWELVSSVLLTKDGDSMSFQCAFKRPKH